MPFYKKDFIGELKLQEGEKLIFYTPAPKNFFYITDKRIIIHDPYESSDTDQLKNTYDIKLNDILITETTYRADYACIYIKTSIKKHVLVFGESPNGGVSGPNLGGLFKFKESLEKILTTQADSSTESIYVNQTGFIEKSWGVFAFYAVIFLFFYLIGR